MRVDQALSILGVIGVDPGDFFRRLYPPRGLELPPSQPLPEGEAAGRVRSQMRSIVASFLAEEVLTVEDLNALVQVYSSRNR